MSNRISTGRRRNCDEEDEDMSIADVLCYCCVWFVVFVDCVGENVR